MLTDHQIMAEFEAAQAILRGHFILSSGLHSDTYLQCARVLMNPKRAEKLCAALAEKVWMQLGATNAVVPPPIGERLGGRLACAEANYHDSTTTQLAPPPHPASQKASQDLPSPYRGEGTVLALPTTLLIDQEVYDIMRLVGLTPEMKHRYPHEFSGGQRQRIAIARAMVLKPKLVVLDEPTSALDRSVQKQVLALLSALQKSHDVAYIFISHDLQVIRSMAHHVMVMKKGEIIEIGDAASVFAAPKDAYTQVLFAAAD
jgi:ABC-type dipeptide/oligopeptide/nickel transport system ATPase component